MAELRGGGACSLPQCSLVSVPVPNRCLNNPLERSLDLEPPGIRLQRRFKTQKIRTQIPAILAATGTTTSDTDGETGTRKFPGTFKLGNRGDNVVFVAGATGNVGSRTVRELLKLGLRVRAGVRDVDKAKSVLEDSIASANDNSSPLLKLLSFLGFKQPDQLEFVDCDLEKPEEIETALGNAGVVVCTIGASEKEVLDVTGPYRIDFQATKNLILAAKNSNVKHFILVTSLGTTKFGWPAAVLNLFWGVLVWKAKAEKALVDSGLVYTIVRPGGMERPTDAFKETHNLRLGPKDSFTGGQVSRLQIAELLACIASNLELAENKILEAIAETTAPRRPIIELLEDLPSQAKEKKTENENGTLQLKKKRRAESTTKLVEEPKDQAVEIDRQAQQGLKKAEDDRRAQQALKKAEDDRKAQQALKKAEAERREKELVRQKAEEEAKEKAAEAEKTRELRDKIAKELADLKKQEEFAVAEAEKLKKKRVELAERAQAASSAASRAEALAKALLGAAKQGKLLSEDDKKKIVSTAKKASSKELVKGPVTKQEPEPKKLKPIPEPKAEKQQIQAKVLPVKEKLPAKAPAPAPSPSPAPAPKVPAKVEAEKKTISEKDEKPAPPPPTKPLEAPTAAENKPKDVIKPEIKAEIKKIEVAASTEEETKKEGSKDVKGVKQEKVEEPKPAPAEAPAAKEVEKKNVEPSKPFRWFWEPPEPEPVQEESSKPENGKPPSRPLSPYYRYTDLKPPVSPGPPGPVVSQQNGPPQSEPDPKVEENKPFRWFWESPEAKAEAKPVKETPKSSLEETKPAAAEEKTEEKPSPAAAAAEEKKPEEKPAAVEEKPPPPLSASERFSVYTKDSEPAPPEPPSSVQEPLVSNVVEASPVSEPVLKPSGDEVPQEKPEETLKEEVDSSVYPKEVKEREQAALEKAKASLVWPWTKAEPSAEKTETKTSKDGVKQIKTEEVKTEKKSSSSRPLSPYWRYPDLKPPTTPSPPKAGLKRSELSKASSFPTGSSEPESESSKDREAAALAKAKASISWPWTKDDDSDGAAAGEETQKPPVEEIEPSLKATEASIPSSPSKETPSTLEPVPPTQSSESLGKPVDDTAEYDPQKRELEALAKAKAADTLVWPWAQPEEVTSSSIPAPEAPTSSTTQAVSRPLSPYSRYDDLKPPASPSPSPPVLTPKSTPEAEISSKKETPKQSGRDSTPDIDEASLEAEARAQTALEKARASIKWTWNQ